MLHSTVHSYLFPQAISPDVDSLKNLAGAAATVTEALNALLQHIKDGPELQKMDQVEECYEALLAAAKAVQTYVYSNIGVF